MSSRVRFVCTDSPRFRTRVASTVKVVQTLGAADGVATVVTLGGAARLLGWPTVEGEGFRALDTTVDGTGVRT
jgi:hypothetical protein